MPLIRPRRPVVPSASAQETAPAEQSDAAPPSQAPAAHVSSAQPDDLPADMPSIVQQAGKAIAHAHLYGPEHSVTAATTGQAYALLTKLMEPGQALSLHVAEGQLFANGEEVEMKSPLMGTFAQALASLNIGSIALEAGMPAEEFADFIRLLAQGKVKQGHSASSADDAEPSTPDMNRFKHLKTQKTVYRAVSENETVVQRDTAGKAEALQNLNDGHIRQIVAFLKGNSDSAPESPPFSDLEHTATQADQLADLIMKSAVVDRQAADLSGGETLGDIVVGCLRRTFDALNRTPGAQTRKGKRAIRKTLAVLEKDLLDRLRETANEGCENACQELSRAVADMTEEIQAADLAAQYVRKQKAATEDEERLIRFIRKQGPRAVADSTLKEQLMSEGLSESGWRELVVRSGMEEEPEAEPRQHRGDEHGGATDETREVSTLISLLNDLTQAVRQDVGREPGGLMKVLEKVGREVDAAIAQTDEKVEALARLATMLAEDDIPPDPMTTPGSDAAGDAPPSPKRLTTVQQRSVMRILGEITQELSQPLSVVACTLDMFRNMDGEALSQSKGPLLDLAKESVFRMEDLIGKVGRVTGMPKELAPDHALLELLDTIPPTTR